MFAVLQEEVTSSVTFNAPSNAIAAIITAYGGGGGAGGGRTGTVDFLHNCGGGGGGGSVQSTVMVNINEGESYTITIGAAGNGGGIAADGSDGGSTLFIHVTGGPTTLATFKGGQRGLGAKANPFATATCQMWTLGGMPVANENPVPEIPVYDDGGLGFWFDYSGVGPGAPLAFRPIPQQGAPGVNANHPVQYPGGGSPQGFLGGTSGSFGSTSGNYYGGGGGGGGGAGPGAAGVAGGNGGNGNNAGNGTNGGSPSAATANTGAGGGGGGGGGAATGTDGFGGAGSSGGSGKLTITWIFKTSSF